MALLIWDQIKRRWWGYVIGCTVYGVLLRVYGSTPEIASVTVMPAFIMIATPDSTQVRRGFVRALLAMPISTKQLGLSWWWTTVGIPNLLLAMITALVLAYSSASIHNGLPMAGYVYHWLTIALMLGLLHFCMSWSGSPDSARSRIEILRESLILIFFLPLLLPLMLPGHLDPPHSVTWKTYVSVTSAMTIVGWFSMEQSVGRYIGFKSEPKSFDGTSAKNFRAVKGCGGLPYLLRLFFSGLAISGLSFVGLYALGEGLFKFFAPSYFPVNTDSPFGALTVFLSYLPVALVGWLCLQLRFLRTLPISAAKLAAILVFIPLLTLPVISHLDYSLPASALSLKLINPDFLHWKADLPPFAVVALLIPCLAWRASSLWVVLPLVAGIQLSYLASSFIDTHLSSTICEAIAILLAFASFALTKRILENSSSAYHARADASFPAS